MRTLFYPIFLLLSVIIISCNKDRPQSTVIEEPSIIVPVEFAQSLFSEYGERRVGLIEAAQNIDDNGDTISTDDPNYIRATRSLTVDYDELKQYLNFIEQEAQKADVSINGLRIYLGKYPDKEVFPDGTPTPYPGIETVFLNPTMNSGNGNVAFAIQYGAQGEITATPIGKLSIRNSSKKSLVKNSSEDSIQSLASNTFTRRPPPYNDDNDYNE